MLDGANNDEGWGRQTMLANVPVGAVQEVTVLSNAFSAEFGLTAGPGAQHRHQVGHERSCTARVCTWAGPAAGRRQSFSTEGLLPAVHLRRAPCRPTLTSITPVDIPDKLNQVSGSAGGRDREGQDVLLRRGRLHATGPHDGALEHAAAVRARQRQPDVCRRVPRRRSSTRASITSSPAAQTLMLPRQLRSLLRHESERRGDRHHRADAPRAVTRAAAGPSRPTTRRC